MMKNNLLITQRTEFDCCYITNNVMNAHRYKVEASAEAMYDSAGNVTIYFEEFKTLLEKAIPGATYIYDRGELIGSPAIVVAATLDVAGIPVCGYDFAITAESICNYIAMTLMKLAEGRKAPIRLKEVKLRETNDSFVTWTRPEDWT